MTRVNHDEIDRLFHDYAASRKRSIRNRLVEEHTGFAHHLARRYAPRVTEPAQTLCSAADLPPGAKRCGTLTDSVGHPHEVLVVRTADRLYAIANACPHAGLPLEGGEVRGPSIVCPFHGYTYRLSDGADVDDPDFGQPVATYPVTLEGDAVRVTPTPSTSTPN